MSKTGIVLSGPYKGQQFVVLSNRFLFTPGWQRVQLVDESRVAWRDVRKQDLWGQQ
jgi:hypothetical protein